MADLEGAAGRDMSHLDVSGLDLERLPSHVGLILDGNGRWANRRGLERTAGHAAGEAALFETIGGALDLGIEWLSAYTFSTENWSRSADEVAFLMFFNEDLLVRRRDELHEQGVRMWFAGDLADPRIPDQNRVRMAEAVELTRNNRVLNMVFAFNYGGRVELTAAVRSIAEDVASGRLEPEDITEATIAHRLYIPDMPDPDLIVRTSGEHRLSNFLLWGSAYAEFIFTPTLWPDFGRQSLVDCIAEYQRRDRRFGAAEDAPTSNGAN